MIEQRREDRRGVKPGETEEINGPIRTDKRGRMQIAYHSMLLNGQISGPPLSIVNCQLTSDNCQLLFLCPVLLPSPLLLPVPGTMIVLSVRWPAVRGFSTGGGSL